MSGSAPSSVFDMLAQMAASKPKDQGPQPKSPEPHVTEEELSHAHSSQAESEDGDSEGSPERPSSPDELPPPVTGPIMDVGSDDFQRSLQGYLIAIHSEVSHLTSDVTTVRNFSSEGHDTLAELLGIVKTHAVELQEVQRKLELLGEVVARAMTMLDKLEKNQATMMKGSVVSQKPGGHAAQEEKGPSKVHSKSKGQQEPKQPQKGGEPKQEKSRSELLDMLSKYRTAGSQPGGGKQ